jgi:hypothetical protein
VLFEHRSFLDNTQRLLSGHPPFSSAQQGDAVPECSHLMAHRSALP